MTPIYQTPEKIKLKFDAIKEPAEFWQNKTVLDVGCNAGLLYELLKDKVKSYTGIDNSKAYIEDAKRNYPGVDFQLMDLYDVNAYYDIVVSLSTFHIFNDSEFDKILKLYSKLCSVLIVEFPVKGKSPLYFTRSEAKFRKIAGKYFKNILCYGISPSPHDLQSVRKVFKCTN